MKLHSLLQHIKWEQAMFRLGSSDASNVFEAMGKSQAVIEFDLTGKILVANENFCNALGYSLKEIVGRHHSMFCEAATIASDDYRAFWRRLGDGMFDAGTYKRIAKDGREIWIQASYNAICRRGKPYKVVKFASDITASRQRAIEDAGKLEALSRSQAVIEFTPAGEILTANENFCKTLGYQLSEIVGKHHRIFCRKDHTETTEYADFWTRLSRGEFIANEFVRLSKSGKEIWIQAAYNPIRDGSGRVTKVVKFATDVTERMSAIQAVNVAMKAISVGDLTKTLDVEFVPSMEDLRGNFNATVAQLRHTLHQIGESASAIASSSREVSDNAESFSKRTEQQAASLEETAAGLEEITTTVRDSSDRAQEAGQLVARTKEGAEASGDVVRNAVAAMGEIEKSSNEITNIIGVIDEIAFQTNLLALNAGVEAARAGDAGKGFAVVAQEVRELAQRSAKAAKEIKALISTSSQLVRNGVDLVDQAGRSLELIVTRVGEINTNIVAVVEAAREQSIGLKGINVAVNSMDQATQRNAAMAEEGTAASQDLADQANALRGLLAHFKTGGQTPTSESNTATVRKLHGSRPRQLSVPFGNKSASARLAIASEWEEF
jgi:methyl-accepting chemotaxis protein